MYFNGIFSGILGNSNENKSNILHCLSCCNRCKIKIITDNYVAELPWRYNISEDFSSMKYTICILINAVGIILNRIFTKLIESMITYLLHASPWISHPDSSFLSMSTYIGIPIFPPSSHNPYHLEFDLSEHILIEGGDVDFWWYLKFLTKSSTNFRRYASEDIPS